LCAASAAEITDSSATFFRRIFDSGKIPPTFDALPNVLPLLPVPLPVLRFDYNRFSGCNDAARLEELAKPLEIYTTTAEYALFAVAAHCSVVRTNGQGVIPVVFDAMDLVLKPMFLALESAHRQYAFDNVDKSGSDALLFVDDILFFKASDVSLLEPS
jgi:hypothetical protein